MASAYRSDHEYFSDSDLGYDQRSYRSLTKSPPPVSHCVWKSRRSDLESDKRPRGHTLSVVGDDHPRGGLKTDPSLSEEACLGGRVPIDAASAGPAEIRHNGTSKIGLLSRAASRFLADRGGIKQEPD